MKKTEINNKLFALILISACLSSSIVTYAVTSGYFTHQNPQAKDNVYVFKESPEGIDLIGSGNLITDIGERYVRNILGFDNVSSNNATKWISLGNSSIVATNTKLDTEATATGFTRALGAVTAWVNSGDYAYNVTKKFTATGNIRINATALHWNSTSNSDGNAFAMASLGGYEDFENNWNCTIVWVVTWNAN